MDARKYITLAIAVPLCLSATLSVADSTPAAATTAMDACLKAFISTAVPKDRQVALRTETRGVTMMPRTRPYSIALTATSRNSGKQLAAATCRTDRNGTVIALNAKAVPSLTAPDAKAGLAAEEK
jgi:hypothetical protein